MAQRYERRSRLAGPGVGICLPDEYELNRMSDPADRCRDGGGIDRVAQSQELGIWRQDAKARTASDILEDGTVDYDPISGGEFQHEASHVRWPRSSDPRRRGD